MDVAAPPRALAALAALVRARLADVAGAAGGSLVPLVRALEAADARTGPQAVREFAGVVVAAAAPFAPTSYSRARLIRQMHASGLLTDDQARVTVAVLDRHDATGRATR